MVEFRDTCEEGEFGSLYGGISRKSDNCLKVEKCGGGDLVI